MTLCFVVRGGWCVQSNGLLQAVLTALGYELYGVAARVVTGVDSIKPEGDLAAMSERAARGQVLHFAHACAPPPPCACRACQLHWGVPGFE